MRASLLRQGAALSILVFALYAGSLRNQLVGYDDAMVLQESRTFFQLEKHPWREIVREMPGRLLRNFSYACDDRISRATGLPPNFTLHLSNVLWHLLACLLAWHLARQFLQPGWAWLAAALFAVHPLQCESVANIAGRRDLLLGVFYLGALAAYIEFRRRSSKAWLALAGLLWFLALNSKQNAVTLPLVCWLYDFHKGKGKTVRPTRRALAAGSILTLAGGLAVLAELSGVPWTWNGGSVATHLLTAGSIVWRALRLFVWPRILLPDYDHAPFLIVLDAASAAAWLKAALVVAAAAFSQTLWKRRPTPAFAAAFFLATFLPTSGLIPWGELFAEHWLYLPSFGLCLAAAWAAGLLHERLRKSKMPAAAPALCAVAVTCLGARAAARSLDWKDGETLWTKAVADEPWSAHVHYTLGTIYGEDGRFPEAMAQYKSALKQHPDYRTAVPAFTNLANLYTRNGQPAKAVRLLRSALALDPRNIMANYNIGALYLGAGRIGEAEAAYSRALDASPGFIDAANTLAALYFSEGKYALARELSWQALDSKHADPMLMDNFGFICEAMGHRDEAEFSYLRAIQENKDRTFLKPYYHLANLYQTHGQPKRAAAVMRAFPAAPPAAPLWAAPNMGQLKAAKMFYPSVPG